MPGKKRKTRRRLTGHEQMKIAFDACERCDLRSGIIIGTALIETALDRLLKSRMRRLSPADERALFGPTGALGPLTTKIRMAYALGIVGPRMHKELSAIAEIRNVFAHTPREVTMRNKKVQRNLINLRSLVAARRAKPELPKEGALVHAIVLCGIMLGYDRPKRTNPKAQSLTFLGFKNELPLF